ncbi:ribokinase [Micromonospora sp. NPDC047707]|uniref:ribokinase n=1 Tax=unclassified Micromonospora TaxID=2617518 RepID=UPI0012B48EC1|nr:ribokinase [Micromonospora sp. WMMC415]QGN48176.1 ribokinase [Micromonospora sp. WMMC415]
MSARVVVVGSANLDLVVSTPQLPRPGETVLGGDFRTVPGGKGANQAVAAARAGAGCEFVGAVGDDAFGRQLRDSLAGAGVGLRGLRTVPGPSGVALIAVDQAAENFIVVAPGANAALTELDADDAAVIGAADVLLLQLEVPLPTVVRAADLARAAGTVVVVNAAPAVPLPAELLDLVDVLVVNEHEAAVVAGVFSDDPAVLLDALLTLVPRVVLTLGARGAAYADRHGARRTVPAPLIDAVDTTAAGDAFTGALAVGWAERGGAPDADAVTDVVRWACAAGAACAQRPGASTALPERAAIDALYTATYRGTE